MTTTYTTNKGYALQGTGDNTNTWGTILNTGVFEIIDKNLGSKFSVDVSGSADITCSATDAQNLYHDLYGTLTGNISYILPNKSGFLIINNRASGAYTITVKPTGGTGVVVPVGKKIIYIDSSSTTAVDAVSFATPTDGSVTAAKLATDAVETAKIKDANVTAAKLASDAVETAKIKDDNVTNAKLDNMAANTVKVNATAGSANPTDIALDASTLLGRGSTGNIDKITIGTGLQISGTVLSATSSSAVFTSSFTSTDQTVSSAGSLTVAHGLGATPKMYRLYMKCTSTDANYSTGSVVPFECFTTTSYGNILSSTSDTANINIRFTSYTMQIDDFSTGIRASIDLAKWKLVINAFA